MNLTEFSFNLDAIVHGLWRATWQGSVLAIIVLAIQSLLARRIGGRGRYLLWSVVVLRLLLPVLPQSSFSIFNLSRFSVPQQKPQMILATGGDVAEPPVTPDLPSQPDIVGAAATVNPVRMWNVFQIAFAAWLLGMVAIIAHMVITSIRWRRSLGDLQSLSDPRTLAIVNAAANDISIRRCPRILVGRNVRTPAVVGVFRPALLLPPRVLEHCSTAQLRLIVLHELAHVKRHDIAANWLLAVASILHWFNPFVWLIAARIRADRELACDETVLAHCDEPDPQAYGQTLLRLIELLSPRAADRHPQLVGILESSGPLQRRMRMIAQYKHQGSARWIWVGMVLLALGCTSLTDSVRGQDRAGSAASPRPATQPAERRYDTSNLDIQRQLQHVLPEAKFDEIPLDNVIGFLRDVSGLNIVVNWRALETAGVDRKVPVSTNLRNVPFEQVLRTILRDVGGGAVRLGYVVEGQVLTITTEEDAQSVATTVFYDVNDLISGSGNSPQAQQSGDANSQRLQSLIQVIEDTIARESWRDNGGNVGSIANFNGKLVVTQTPENHRQIKHLLDRLREGPTTQPRPLVGMSL